MFPFNQAYRARQITPDPPVSPVSAKSPGPKRIRIKTRAVPYPYARPVLPTPSSPSEAEYEHIPECSASPRLEKIEFANPLELTRQETPTEEPIPQETSNEALKYGDLVVVDYAEKKKVYKWPAIIVPAGHMTDNMLDLPPENDETAIGVRWIEPSPSYSWVPERTVRRLTPAMIEETLATITGPKKLLQAWEMAKHPPSPFEYLLEKKMPYHILAEKYKSL